MRINATIDENLITPAKHRQLMNFLLRLTMTQHRDGTLPTHFAPGAAGKYGYKPLKRGYIQEKIKKTGKNVPMVFTGRLRDVVKATSKVTATATKARIYGKGYFTMKDDFRKQIEVVTPDQLDNMAELIGNRYAYFVKQPEWARKRRKKS
jgi:hypothetical protein